MKSMKNERPEVGSVVKCSINNQMPECYEIAGYFDKTRSVFLYEHPYTPIVLEWDDVTWECIEEAAVREMCEDIGNWQQCDVHSSLQEYLIKKGWRKDCR